MPEAPLQPLPSGKLKLGAEHFRKVVRRIEDIKPLAGEGIKITPKEGGIEVAVSAGINAGIPAGFSVIELAVCRNGEPGFIQVLGYDEGANVEPEPD